MAACCIITGQVTAREIMLRALVWERGRWGCLLPLLLAAIQDILLLKFREAELLSSAGKEVLKPFLKDTSVLSQPGNSG